LSKRGDDHQSAQERFHERTLESEALAGKTAFSPRKIISDL
jgi:hypothetical protein